MLFLGGIPTVSYRLASTSVTADQDRTVGYAVLVGAILLTAFTTWANFAETNLFGFVFLLAFHPILLTVALLAVNETDWKDKETIKRWLWSLLLLSILIYCANGLYRTNYWFGYGRGG